MTLNTDDSEADYDFDDTEPANTQDAENGSNESDSSGCAFDDLTAEEDNLANSDDEENQIDYTTSSEDHFDGKSAN